MPEGNWPLRKSWMIKYKQQTRSQRAGKSQDEGTSESQQAEKTYGNVIAEECLGKKRRFPLDEKKCTGCVAIGGKVPEEAYTLYHYAFGLGF